MAAKEAKARIKINKLLEAAGWRFLDDLKLGKANIALEPNVKLTIHDIDELGEDFEETTNGFVDFLLLDDKGFPFLVLEAEELHLEFYYAEAQTVLPLLPINTRE